MNIEDWDSHKRADGLTIGARFLLVFLILFSLFLGLATSWNRSDNEVKIPAFENLEGGVK